MSPIDEDTLQAYVDGELDASTAARIDAALAHDEALARRVRQARAMRRQVRAAFDPILDEPVPARLTAMLRPPSEQATTRPSPHRRSPGGHRTGATRHRVTRSWFASGAALAATAALLAVTLWWRPGGDMVHMQDGQPFAAGALRHALDDALASAPDPAAPVAIGLSFRSTDGHVCRTFTVRTAPAKAGLACHGDSGWALPVLSTAPASDHGELRQAMSGVPPEVQAAVDARLRGQIFDARQERAARDAGWR